MDSHDDRLGASEVAALFDCSPWESAFSLWCKKTGLAPAQEQTPRMQMGLDLEQKILELWAKREGLTVEWNTTTYRHPELPFLSATPDGFVVNPEGERIAAIDVKTVNVSAIKDWADGVPEHYRLQQQTQMLCTGCRKAFIVVLDGGFRLTSSEMTPDHLLQKEILLRASVFQAQLKGELAPPPVDDHRRTTEALLAMPRNDAAPTAFGEEALPADAELREASAKIADLLKYERRLKAIILRALGSSSSGFFTDGSGWRVQTVARAGYEVKPSKYQKMSRVKNNEAQDDEE